MNDVSVRAEGVEVLANQGPMNRRANGVRRVIELLGHEDPLVARVGRRLGEISLVDVVDRPPWRTRPMRASLEDIVLEVMLVQKEQSLLVTQVGERLQAVPVPGVVPGQVIAA